ncbi:glycosyltransferase family 2 protein [bacterium]|nr:glycosyltransferase family 2 protein [candidate division CSSED10-310 bacterium]
MRTPLPIMNRVVSVIIVSYESSAELESLLPSLTSEALSYGLEIIVVDNGSGDETKAVLNRFTTDITIIYNAENVGFATAVNQGIRISSAPFILLLNPDADLSLEAIQELKTYLDDKPAVAAVAPRIEFPDGRIQPSRGSFPSILRTIAHLFQLKRLMPDDETIINSPLRCLGRLFKQYAPLPVLDQEVDYTTGACVLLRRTAMDQVGGMDEQFFLYYEEIDLAKRLKNAGYSWVFLTSVVARHQVAASSRRIPLKQFYERYRSMCYYFSKHHSYFATILMRQMLYLTILIRWGLVSISGKFRLDPRSPLRDEINIYRLLLKS